MRASRRGREPVAPGRHWGVIVAASAVAAVTLVLAVAGQLHRSDVAARESIESSSVSRTDASGQYIDDHLGDLQRQAQAVAERVLAGPEPTAADFERVVDALGFESAVLVGPDGVVTHGRGGPDLVGQRLADRPAHIRAAGDGRPAVATVTVAGPEPVPTIVVAVPVATPAGPRVFSGGFPVARSPVAAFVASTASQATSRTYLVDDAGQVIVDSGGPAGGPLAGREPALAAELAAGRTHGRYTEGDQRRFFSETRLDRAPWRLVRGLATERLYAALTDSRRAAVITFWLIVAGAVGGVALVGHAARARWRLGRARRFLADILDAAPEPTIVLDRSGRLRHANRAWFEATAAYGRDHRDDPDRDYLDQCRRRAEAGVPGAGQLHRDLTRLLAGETDDVQVDVAIRRPDGSPGWFRVRATTTTAGDGGALVSLADITAERANHERLRRDKERTEVMAAVAAALASSGVHTPTVARTITDEIAEHIGDQCTFLLHRPDTDELHLLAVSGRDPDMVEATRRTAARSPQRLGDPLSSSAACRERVTKVVDVEQPAQFHADLPERYRRGALRTPIHHMLHVPVLDGDRLLGAISVGRFEPRPFDHHDVELVEDIAVRAGYAITTAQLFEAKDAAERDLARANEDLARFAATASHDLQAPLRRMAAFSSLVADDYRDRLDDTGREYLDYIQSSAQHLSRLTGSLLELAKVADQDMDRRPVDLNHLVAVVTGHLHDQMADTGASVTADDLPVVDGDAGLLERLLQNVIANALKYQPPGHRPVIHVQALAEGPGRIALAVSDNGIGIDPAHLDAVFQPFRRLHADSSGTGLGLAVCQRIVERHGGRIRAVNNPAGGTTVTATLPLHQPADQDQAGLISRV